MNDQGLIVHLKFSKYVCKWDVFLVGFKYYLSAKKPVNKWLYEECVSPLVLSSRDCATIREQKAENMRSVSE